MFENDFIEMLKTYETALDDPKKFVGLIHDLFPEEEMKSNLIITGYHLGIVSEIQKAKEIDGIFANRFVKVLLVKHGISEHNAKWAITTWCVCYGKTVLGKSGNLTIDPAEPTPGLPPVPAVPHPPTPGPVPVGGGGGVPAPPVKLDDFGAMARTSARKYYKYLDVNKKGVAEYKVEHADKSLFPGYYQFYLDKRPLSGDYLEIRINDVPLNESEGKVVELNSKRRIITVRLDKQHAAGIEALAKDGKVTVVSDLKFLVKRLGIWYKDFGDRVAFPQKAGGVPLYTNANLKNQPSLDQRVAVEGILSKPFTYVWGAPGTGKTQCVLAFAALSYIAQNKQILLTAPTNNAVEQMLRGVLPVMEEAGFDIDKLAIRCGIPSSRFAEKYPGVCQSKAFVKETESLNERIKEMKDRIKDYDKKLKVFQEYHAFETEVSNLKHFEDDSQRILNRLEEYMTVIKKCENEIIWIDGRATLQNSEFSQLKENRIKLTEKIAALTNKVRKHQNSVWRKIGLVNYEGYRAELESAMAEEEKLRKDIEEAEKTLAGYRQEISKYKRTIEESKRDFENERKKLVSQAAFHKGLASATGSLNYQNPEDGKKKLLAAISKLNAEHAQKAGSYAVLHMEDETNLLQQKSAAEQTIADCEARKKALSESGKNKNPEDCLVVACTVDYCLANILPDNPSYHFEHLFLDEAGYCSLIKGCTLLGYGKPVAFLGDHKQLPPVCEMNDREFKENDNWPVFMFAQSVLHVEDALNANMQEAYQKYMNHADAQFTILKKYDLLESYRFGDSLAKILAGEVYNPAFHGQAKIGTSIIYIDAPKVPGKVKRTNLAEIDAIADYLADHKADVENIGVLTPYKNQSQLLVNAARKNGFPFDSVVTVHGSQGREWQTVILSVVDTDDMFFTDTKNHKGNGLNLINTAVSRARQELIIVCDYNYWIRQKSQLICKLLENAKPI